jgi:2-phospho-L-lactate guanylyltransferase (CobY/MobA/RfbA family)
MERPSAPTLLVFTLGPRRESARRSLLPAGLREVEIAVRESCLETALAAGRACGCRLEVCSPSPLAISSEVHHAAQSGGDFGSRLEGAMRDAYARGAGSLVIVGTDVPGLAERHVARALALLAEDPDRVVLGPSPDGGFYLLAVRRPIENLGSATRWCRRQTLRGLLRALRAAGRPAVLLQPLTDLDRPADLDRWLAARPGRDERWRGLARELRQLVAEIRRPLMTAWPAGPRLSLVTAVAGRAPPDPAVR